MSMDAKELKTRIAKLKQEKREEERRMKLRGEERGAIAESREAKRERRIAGIGLAVEKAKVYKALPLPHISPRDSEEAVRRAERLAEKSEAEARRRIALSQRKTEVSRAAREAAEAEAEQRKEEQEAKRTRVMSDRALRAAKMKPIIGVGKAVGKAGVGIAKVPIKVLKALGRESEKYARAHPTGEPPLDLSIDLGFDESKEKERKRRKEPPIDLNIKIL